MNFADENRRFMLVALLYKLKVVSTNVLNKAFDNANRFRDDDPVHPDSFGGSD